MEFSSGCEENERQSSEIPIALFQMALTHSAVDPYSTVTKANWHCSSLDCNPS